MDASGTRRIKRTLEQLAARTDTDRPPYLAVIDEAAAACRDIERAAGFIDADGLDRLATAIESAVADDAIDHADRGRHARSIYHRFRRAAAGDAVADIDRDVSDTSELRVAGEYDRGGTGSDRDGSDGCTES